ncbi:MAG: UDP-N-acetylmuramate dehydrogenase [Armatimonadetes bacterium]|nr:UDP-N-acetylmuramate dehydrogenase [Armatimonadota bacterium]
MAEVREKSRLARELMRLLPGQVRLDEPMKLHTTWRIGGPADLFVEPDGVAGLAQALAFARRENLPVTIIGNGSNLLVKDGGIRGLVVKIGGGFRWLNIQGSRITAGAGTGLARLTGAAKEAGVGGFEFLAGIPGTVGGAVVMNAGAFGKATSDLCASVQLMDETGRLAERPGAALGFGYRTSNLQGSKLIVVAAVFRGTYREPQAIQAEMEDLFNRRKKTQPLGCPSAGSVFQNPPGISAGFLIERAGGKGMRAGDAAVSPVHANFIVNLGNATARDVLKLIEQVKIAVREKYAIELKPEVQIIGED